MCDAMMNGPLITCRETVLRHRQRNSPRKQCGHKRETLQDGHNHPPKRIRLHAGECPLLGGVFNRSTQHLLILPEEEVCDGGDCTNMVHPAAEG